MKEVKILLPAILVILLTILACNLPTSANAPTEDTSTVASDDQTTSSTLVEPTQTLETIVVPSPTPTEVKMPFQLASSAFTHGSSIPVDYTCNGRNISPPLSWGNPPETAQSLALILDDPDAPAGTWVHWVLYNMPPTLTGLPEDISPDAQLADGSLQGKNSWGRIGYGAPCPPSGTHRYYFKLYALDTLLDLPSGASKVQLIQAMEGHILEQTELVGTYR